MWANTTDLVCAPNGATANFCTTEGVTYTIIVASDTTATGDFALVMNEVGPPAGVCCNNNTGICTTLCFGSCPAGTTLNASTTTCGPTACPTTRVCCNNTSAACQPNFGPSCPSGTTEVSGLTCEPSSCSQFFGACCQQQTGACVFMGSADCAALTQPGTFLGVSTVCPGGLCYGEREPNSTTFAAFLNDPLTNPATLSHGDSITGITTGGGLDAGNNGNGTASNSAVDFWLVSTSAQPLGIYRRELTQIGGSTSASFGFGFGLRGRAQTLGVPSGGNNPLQGSNGSPKRVAWYGFGKQEKVIVEPFGTSSTSTPYVLQLNDTPVTPTIATGTVVEGAVTIRVVSTGATTIDSDAWLYDGNFNALTNGAGGPGGAEGQLAAGDPAGTTSSFTRTLAPGTYYLAVCPSNLANDQPNDPIEGITSTGPDTRFITYFPDVVICDRMNQTADYTAHVEVVDGSSNTITSPDISWTGSTAAWHGLVHFVQFTVGTPVVNGACCCGSSCSITTAAACSGLNQTFAGAGTACTPFSFTAPCCRGNFNKSVAGPGAPGGISVQDIFDFLTGYFSNDACANTNDSAAGPGAPNGVSVQDIFDFLAAYFGGC
ncbi:MAG: hypothetical protein IT438_11560 [Phycisphaerales bacterium]|nr:hypothetical protein [Phycisphaerales bacterium]